MTTIEKLKLQKDEAYNKIATVKEEVKEIGKSIFKLGFEEIFKKYPKLENISWKQYTSYFCDGEPCEFESYHHDYSINGYSWEEYKYQDKNDKLDFNKKEYKPLYNDINALMENFSTDDMKLLFGDHVKVTVTRNGVEVEGYTNHD